MAEYVVRPLTNDTWDAFAALVERHNGVWGAGVWRFMPRHRTWVSGGEPGGLAE